MPSRPIGQSTHKSWRDQAIRKRLDNLLEFFGLHLVADLNGSLQRQYVERRGFQSAAVAIWSTWQRQSTGTCATRSAVFGCEWSLWRRRGLSPQG
jgi:hypothetical protein